MHKAKILNLTYKKDLRRELRQQKITCERLMWNKLRNRAICDLKFRRQHGVGKYVVDFYCSEVNLVVEIDGATHGTEEEIKYDKLRQQYLNNNGFIVKRYDNFDVKNNLEALLNDLIEYCRLALRKSTSP